MCIGQLNLTELFEENLIPVTYSILKPQKKMIDNVYKMVSHFFGTLKIPGSAILYTTLWTWTCHLCGVKCNECKVLGIHLMAMIL